MLWFLRWRDARQKLKTLRALKIALDYDGGLFMDRATVALEQRVATLEKKPGGASADEVAALRADIDQVKAAVDSVVARVQTIEDKKK